MILKGILIKGLLFTLVALAINTNTYSQVLMTKSFAVILDSTKKVKGNVMPSFKFQTQTQNLIEFDNKADIAIKINKGVLTFANNIELSKFGKTTLLSGGYVYAEHRLLLERKIAYESYLQVQWAEARGLELKYAGGVNLRYKALAKDNIGVFVGIGPFYEFERWNYNGVSDDKKPIVVSPVTNNFLKLGSYFSLKYNPLDKIFLDISLYHQSKLNEVFSGSRLAGSFGVIYKVTKNVGLGLTYQKITDYNPVVPINRNFHKINSSVTISF